MKIDGKKRRLIKGAQNLTNKGTSKREHESREEIILEVVQENSQN